MIPHGEEDRLGQAMKFVDRPRIALEMFQLLEVGYPKRDGEIRRMVNNRRIWLVKAVRDPQSGKFFLNFKRPVIRVKAEVRRV